MKNVTGMCVIVILSALAVTAWSERRTPAVTPVNPTVFAADPAPADTPDTVRSLPPAAYTSPAPRYITIADRRYDSDRDYETQPEYNNNYRRVPRYGAYGHGAYPHANAPYSNSAQYGDPYYGERPASHSAVIIGGSAAAGAAIGGLAGGGKGAAIGALAGGGAGLIYDRITHENARW